MLCHVRGHRPPRDHVIHLRLSDGELRALDQFVALSGANRSDVLRAALLRLLEPAETLGLVDEDDADAYVELLREYHETEAAHFGPAADHPSTAH